MFKSERLNWKTPREVYNKLNEEFHFDFDPCPSEQKFDGLKCQWGECNFVNPPYGREIIKWVDKAISEFETGKTIIMLVASRTDTVWWHKLTQKATEIRFIKGRLHFDEHKNSAPFPSAIIIMNARSVV